MLIYLNYILDDGGFQIRQKAMKDKYAFLLNPTEAKEKLYYKPHKRSHAKTETLYSFIKNYLLHPMMLNMNDAGPHVFPRRENNKIEMHIQNLFRIENKGDNGGYILKMHPSIDEFLKKYDEYKHNLENKNELYRTIKIPKKKLIQGKKKYREINEPVEPLKELQRMAKKIIDDIMHIHPHNSVHSYTYKRDSVTNGQMHKYSKHVVKMDIKNFFPSINKKLLYRQLIKFKEFAILQYDEDGDDAQNREKMKEQIHKFFKHYYILVNHFDSTVIKSILEDLILQYYLMTKKVLSAILNVAIYKNQLPQGSPLSPTLSNLVLFEIDHKIEEKLRHTPDLYSESMLMHTRYGDDMTFSSFNPIHLDNLQIMVKGKLEKMDMQLHEEKTQYTKTTNRCYITGVKINKDQEATYGHEKKEALKRDIFHLFMMYKEGSKNRDLAQETLGQLAYLQRIEPAYARKLITKYSRKFGIRPDQFYKYFININT